MPGDGSSPGQVRRVEAMAEGRGAWVEERDRSPNPAVWMTWGTEDGMGRPMQESEGRGSIMEERRRSLEQEGEVKLRDGEGGRDPGDQGGTRRMVAGR